MKYNVLLICAGGISTTIIRKKMFEYCQKAGHELSLVSCGVGNYQDFTYRSDVVLVAPQIAYRYNEIKELNKPTSVIPTEDYCVANCSNIFKLIDNLYKEIQ